MKKMFLFVAAAVIAASCAKSGQEENPSGEARIVVKIAGAKTVATTRAVEDPSGDNLTPGLDPEGTHYVYVLDASQNVSHAERLDLEKAPVAKGGQLLGQDAVGNVKLFSTKSTVYVLANAPAVIRDADGKTLVTANLGSWKEIQTARSAIAYGSSPANHEYLKPAMGNSDDEPQELNPMDTANQTATAAVTINPLYARVELAGVKGSDFIASFKVEGVYLDNYYSSFTMNGKSAGAINTQGQATTFTSGWFGDSYTTPLSWASGGSDVVPATDKIWAYHVGPGDIAHFIVKLSAVYAYQADSDGNPDKAKDPVLISGTSDTDVMWITTTSYNDGKFEDDFERGKIYRVSAISFTPAGLASSPNPKGVKITATITIKDWVPVNLSPDEI